MDESHLVIAEDTESIPTLWTELGVHSVVDARHALARRESIQPAYVGVSVGYWHVDSPSSHDHATSIGIWAERVGARAVVWTALKPRFRGKPVKPSCNEVLAYLTSLKGKTRDLAEQYIRCSPQQIRTHYRSMIELKLGWTGDGSQRFC